MVAPNHGVILCCCQSPCNFDHRCGQSEHWGGIICRESVLPAPLSEPRDVGTSERYKVLGPFEPRSACPFSADGVAF